MEYYIWVSISIPFATYFANSSTLLETEQSSTRKPCNDNVMQSLLPDAIPCIG